MNPPILTASKPFKSLLSFLFLFFILTACDNEHPEEFVSQTNNEMVDSVENNLQSSTDTSGILEEEIYTNPIDRFVHAVLNENKQTVANMIKYPLKREAPLPPILDETDFLAYYPLIFDDSLKKRLKFHTENSSLIDRSGINGSIGILSGLIWFIDSTVITINYESNAEQLNREKEDQSIRNRIHPILKTYKKNIFIGKTETYLFRLDETSKGLRYAQWYGNQTMNDEPDLILWDGISERQGTQGGNTTTFISKTTSKYIIDDVRMAESDEQLGIYLIMYEGGIETYKEKVIQILDPNYVLPSKS